MTSTDSDSYAFGMPARSRARGSSVNRFGTWEVAMFGKVRIMIMDAPRHIVIFDNGKRTRLFPVVVGK